jgi:hypothetical protein
VLLNHVEAHEQGAVVEALADAVVLWRAYRDDVAAACGLTKP